MNINRISGLASGLDIDQMVMDMMRAHRLRLDKVKQDKQIWQWRQEDYRSLNASLFSLRNEVFNLKLQGTFQAKQATSNNEQLVTATAGSNAAATTYQVKVERLATAATGQSAESIATDNFDPSKTLASQQDNLISGADFGWDPDTHEFSFTINGQTFNFDGDTVSLNSVIAAVNSNKEAGVSMFYDASAKKVAIATTQTGSTATINVEGNFLTSVLKLENTQGQDALFEINGLSGITSHTNSYTVNGTTFNFKGADTGKTVTVSVVDDIDAMVNSIKSFVDRYNETIISMNTKLYEKRYPDYRPLTDEQQNSGELTDRQIDAWQEKARSGLLKGDMILSDAVSGMRSVLSGLVQGVTGEVTVSTSAGLSTTVADRLSAIGITTVRYEQGSEQNGKLELNEKRLREALQSNPEAVMELFTRTRDADGNEITDPKQKGLAVQLYDTVNNAMKRITSQAGSSGSLYDDSYISRTVRYIDKNLVQMEKRYQDLENRYYRQFTVMEQAIARMNAQSNWLTAQLQGGGQS